MESGPIMGEQALFKSREGSLDQVRGSGNTDVLHECLSFTIFYCR